MRLVRLVTCSAWNWFFINTHEFSLMITMSQGRTVILIFKEKGFLDFAVRQEAQTCIKGKFSSLGNLTISWEINFHWRTSMLWCWFIIPLTIYSLLVPFPLITGHIFGGYVTKAETHSSLKFPPDRPWTYWDHWPINSMVLWSLN